MFVKITVAKQREFKKLNEGREVRVPLICSSYGTACRQMEKEEGANRALCHGCDLAAFCGES